MPISGIRNKDYPYEYIAEMSSLDGTLKVEPKKVDPINHEDAKKVKARPVSPWTGKDTLVSCLDSKTHKTSEFDKENIHNNAKKAIVPGNIRDYYRDTLESMEQDKKVGTIDKKPLESTQATSSWYESTIKPAQKLEQIQPSLLSDEEDTKLFTNSMSEFINEAKRADDAGEINFEALLADIFRMQIDYQEETSGLYKDQLRTAKTERTKINQDRLKKMDEILDRARTTRMWDRINLASSGLQLGAAALGLSTGWGVVAFAVIAFNTTVQVFGEQAASYLIRDQESAGWWASAAKMGLSIVASVFSVGAQIAAVGNVLSGAATAFKGMISATQGTSAAFNGLNTYYNNSNHGEMTKLTDEASRKNDKMKGCIKDIQQLAEAQHLLWQQWRRTNETKSQTTQMIFSQQ